MANQYEEKLRQEWEKFSGDKETLLPNIMLLGMTGCGKSSLINLVFGKYLAPVNDVSRGTEGFHAYRGADHGLGVNLIDSRGYEMEDGSGESFQSYYAAIQRKLTESGQKAPLEKIHIIWYCLSVAGEKVQDYDTKILRLLRGIPELRERVAVVLTKCDQDDEDGGGAKIFKKILADEVGSGLPVFEVSTDPNVPLDLEKMMEWSANQLGDGDLREAFVASQMLSLKAKHETAAKVIAGYAAAAAAIGATPLPVADAMLLTPEQVAMSAHIIHIYGMDSLAHISNAVLGNIVVSNLGKSIAGGLLKLIPGVGTVIGGVINGSVAALITSAIGFAVSEICYDCCKRLARGEQVDMGTLFDLETMQNYTGQYLSAHKNGK